MREAVFVRRRAPHWQALEAVLEDARADPDVLADGYVRLGDDLAYAKTFYAGSATAAYLNDLSGQAHAQIYRNRREERGRLRRFWTHEIPLAVYASRRALIASLLLFVGAVGIGIVSSANDDGFVRLILGDGYVNMTLANIEDGDPFAVYKDAHPADMALGIAVNNIRVSFLAFAGFFPQAGLPGASVGTGSVLVSNGIMVGAFAHLFAAQGLVADWFRVVFIHGMLELTAIVIAGGAGLTMWNAVLFPGTYPRLAAFRRGATRGLKVIVGLVPVFAFAAVLEGVVTRRTEMPLWASAVVIGGSAAFLVYYFVYLPASRGRAAHA
ncbi:stage II sporulation protein M [Rubrivirga sp.]|uniref:stage II sporulation protein M n=1 Tax=Rubrivirga sp. TaxID=1885344 RepID=UPI003C70E6F8